MSNSKPPINDRWCLSCNVVIVRLFTRTKYELPSTINHKKVTKRKKERKERRKKRVSASGTDEHGSKQFTATACFLCCKG